MKSIIRVTFIFVLVFTLMSCGDSNKVMLSDYDIELPNGVESKLPMPKDSKVSINIAKDGRYGIMFSPSLNYPESVAFFSKNISPDDWEIEESISEKTEGERDSKWNLRGHQVKVRLDITTFGGEEGFGTSGYYHIERVDD